MTLNCEAKTNIAEDYEANLRNTQERYRWLILSLNTVIQILHSCIITAAGTLAPFLSIELGLTKSMLGMTGGAVNIGASLTSFIAGRLADKKGEKYVLVLGSILAGLAIILASQAVSFLTLLFLLLLTGMCASAPMPVGSKAISKWFPPSRLGFALSLRQTGVPLGGVLAALLLPFVAEKAGWRLAFTTAGLLLIAGGIVCQLAYKDSPAAVFTGQQRQSGSKPSHWEFIHNSNIWRCIFTAAVLVGTQYTMLSYLVLYIHEQIGFSIPTAARFLALAQFGGIISRILTGLVSDTLFKSERKPMLVIDGIIAVMATIPFVFFHSSSSFWVVMAASFFFGISIMGWNAIMIALVMKLAGKEQEGVAIGFYFSAVASGIIVFPPLFGLLFDLTGTYKSSWVFIICSLILAVISVISVKEPKLVKQ